MGCSSRVQLASLLIATTYLLVVAQESDEEKTLLAVGSRGHGAFRRVRLGSVSTDVLRASGGPVLVCPHAAAKPPNATQAKRHSEPSMGRPSSKNRGVRSEVSRCR